MMQMHIVRDTIQAAVKTPLIRRIIASILFVALFFAILVYASDKLLPVDLHFFVSRRSVRQMDQLPANSIDVMSIGGSTSYRSFSAYELYRDYGISAYCFGTSNQPMDATYYIIQEVLRTQNPTIIIVEPENLVGSPNEAGFRRVIDVMPFDTIKAKSVLEHMKTTTAESLLSYIFPVVKYHTTWKGVNNKSFMNKQFVVNPVSNAAMYAGFYMTSAIYGQDYPVVKDSIVGETVDLNAVAVNCLSNIVKICKEHDIALLLYSSIRANWTQERHNAIQAFANVYNLTYIDFNTEEHYTASGLSYKDDLADAGHTNTFGAIKTTHYLGKIITSLSSLPDRRNDPDYAYLAKELPDYEHWVSVEHLQVEKNMISYLSDITGTDSGDYTVFFSVRDEASQSMGEELKDAFKNAGFTVDFTGKYRCSFLGIIQDGVVIYEQIGSDKTEALKYEGSTPDGTEYSLESAGMEAGNRSVIQISGGTNLSINSRGFNMVVYDNRTHRVVDSAAWDTFAPDTIGAGRHKAMTP